MHGTLITPSQPQEPIALTRSPDWAFQQIVTDLFHVGDHKFLACADRLTSWFILYPLSHEQANASRIISICREIFQNYGTQEELSSDGGLPFTSLLFKQFLENWSVKHRLSSIAYPQSNGPAELAVKTAKRIVNSKTGT